MSVITKTTPLSWIIPEIQQIAEANVLNQEIKIRGKTKLKYVKLCGQ